MFVEGLEDKTPEIRAGACEALGKLEVSSEIRNKSTIIHRLQNYELPEKKHDLVTSLK